MRGKGFLAALALSAATVLPAAKSFADTTWLLNDFETANQFAPTWGWHATTWQSQAVSQSPNGATGGNYSMAIDANGNTGFQWGASVEYNVYPGGPPDAIQQNAMTAFNWAGDGREAHSHFEFDVVWLGPPENDPGHPTPTPDDPNSFTGGWEGVTMAMNSNNGWVQTQPGNLAERHWGTNGFDQPVETIHVVTGNIGTTSWSGAGTNKLPNGDAQWIQLYISLNPTSLPAVMHIDNLVLVTPDYIPEPASLGLVGLAGLTLLRRRH